MNLSSLSKLTVGLSGNVSTMNVKFEDANGRTGVLQLTQLSSSEQFWNIDLSLLGSSVDRSRIKAIYFYVDQTNVAVNRRTGSFSVRLNGWNVAKPAVPQLDANISLLVNADSVFLKGTKEAYSSVYINGKLVVEANSATVWGATMSLKEGSNSFSLSSKNSLGASSTTQKITVKSDLTPPQGSLKTSDGKNYTYSGEVTLSLSASDKTSGIDAICISVESGGCSWEPFTAKKTISLPGAGANTINYALRDKVGNTSSYSIVVNNLKTEAAQTLANELASLLSQSAVPEYFRDSLLLARQQFQWKIAQYTQEQMNLLYPQLSTRDQALLKIIRATSQEISEGTTDASLENWANSNPNAEKLFSSKDVINNLSVLESMSPQSVAAFIGLVAVPHFAAPSQFPTWAAESLTVAFMDVRYNAFAQKSTLVKLLVKEGVLPIHTATRAYFTWSGIPDIWISLPSIVFNSSDTANLTRLKTSGMEPYRTWAAKALLGL